MRSLCDSEEAVGATAFRFFAGGVRSDERERAGAASNLELMHWSSVSFI